MKNGKVTALDELKSNPLSDEDMVRIQEELTNERERQKDIKKAAAKKKREANPVQLLARIDSLESQMKSVIEVLQKQSTMIDRLIRLNENNRER